MREVVEAVRALLRCDGPVTYDGAYVHLDGVELDYVHQERRAKEVPLYIGATGMQMMELAGEIADGVVLNYLVSPAYNERALAALAAGAATGGAHRSTTSTGRSSSCARSTPTATPPSTPPACSSRSTWASSRTSWRRRACRRTLLDDIGQVLTWPATHEQVVAASKLVPDEVVQMLCAAGTADECRAKVAEYVATGCTCPILYPLGDVEATLEAFAPAG